MSRMLTRPRQLLTGVASVLAASALVAGCGGAQNATGSSEGYPEKKLRWVVPYPPGGGTDATSRIIASCLESGLGQTVVVENVSGASGARGTKELIQAKPDGYTVGLAITTGMTATPLAEDVGFTKDDLQPIGSFVTFGMVIGVGPKSPYKTAEQFFAAVKAKPGTVTIGVPGTSSPKAIAFDMLAKEYGLKFRIVPMEGSGAVNNALLGGQVEAAGLDADLATKPFVDSGKFKALVSIGPKPWSLTPDIPTLATLGYPKASLPDYSFFLAGPKGMPGPVVDRLEGDLKTCVGKPEVQQKIGGKEYVEPFLDRNGVKKALDEQQAVYERAIGKK